MHTNLRETIETEVQTRIEDYGDLVVQNFGSYLLIPASNLPNVFTVDSTLNSHDVMGDIDRYGADEAVLLGQRLRMLELSLPGTYTAESDVRFKYELSFDNESINGDRTVNGEFQGGAYGTNSSIDDYNKIDNDVLYWTAGHMFNQFADGATGVGGGADTFRTEDETNYLTDIGVLPEVSAREQLVEHLRLENRDSATPEDGQLSLNSSWQLYWLETDDEIEGRQIDMFDD